MQSDSAAGTAFEAIRELCDEATPGVYGVEAIPDEQPGLLVAPSLGPGEGSPPASAGPLG